MSALNDEAVPGWTPNTAYFDNTLPADSKPNAACDKAGCLTILELQAREFEAAAELQKLCTAIGAQAGASAVLAMASALAKVSAARMVAEREVRS